MIKKTSDMTSDSNSNSNSNRSLSFSSLIKDNNGESLANCILESCTEYSIVAFDLDLRIIAWNEGARRLFFYEAKEIVGKTHISLLHSPEDMNSGKIMNIIETTKQKGKWSGELVYIRKDGKIISVLSNVTILVDSSGNAIGYTLLSHDETETNNKLQILVESKEYTRSLIESNMDILITTDTLGIINDVNQQICEATELSREKLIGSPFKTHFTDQKHAEDLIRKVLSENRITNYELTLKSIDAKLTPVSFNATTFRSEDGHLKGIFATARNITEQKCLESQSKKQSESLLEARNLLSDVLKSSISYSIIALDLDGNILIWNEGAKQNYKYSADEMVGKNSLWILHTPEDIQSGRVKAILDEALEKGKYDDIFEHVRKNDERFPALLSVTVRRDAEGNPVGYVLISKDITIQKQQEQILLEQLSYNRSLFDSSIDMLMATDVLGIITDVNKQMCRISGYSFEEIVGTEFKNYFTDYKHAEDCIRQVLCDEIVSNYELTIKAKDGKETIISCNATIFKGTDQNLRGVFTVARDITEQKRLEVKSLEQNTKLKEATGFLNNVLESSTAYSIIAEDLEGNILAWNEGAKLNYGYTAEEMVGKQNTRILHAPEDIQSGRLQAVLDSALKTGKEEGVLESVRKNGERFTASLALTLRKDANGNPVGYLLISKDITSQKREEILVSKNVELEKQSRLAQEANRLKSEFLANMSHELRSPLNGIIGFAELMHLEKVGPVSSEHKEYLGDILTSARHLLQLINDILDLAKVESGKMEFHNGTVDLNMVINEVCDILRTLIAKKKIALTISINPVLNNVIADPAKLKQILYNYISNAVKFSKESGTITISVNPEGSKFYRLEVLDNGIGIREEDIHKLFTEFQQLDSSLDKKYQGTGLGLALTKRIAEAQGGQVGVKSTYNEGSNFYVILPKVPPVINNKSSATPKTSVSNTSHSSKLAGETNYSENVITSMNEINKPRENIISENSLKLEKRLIKVLVIEDTPEDNDLLAKTLTTAGYIVEIAFTGAEAVKICQEKQFNVITLDLLLPDMNGWDVLRSFRSKGPNIETPAVVVTVIASKATSFGFMIQDFLIKPIDREVLIKAIQQSGILQNQNKTILIIDDEKQMLTLYEQYLKDFNAEILYERDAQQAFIAAGVNHPDLIILDLLMPDIDGLEFLRRLRLSEFGKTIPVIFCTSQDINDIDRSRIKASVEAVIQKGGGSMDTILEEIGRILSL